MSKCCSYLLQLDQIPTCISVYGDTTNCNCLHYLCGLEHGDLDTVSTALLNYHELLLYWTKSHQLDRLQYLQALSNANWTSKAEVEKKCFACHSFGVRRRAYGG